MEETGRLLSAAHGTSVKDIKVVALAGSKWYTGMVETRGCSSLVEYDLPKVGRRVRFPSAAGTSPGAIQGTFFSSQRPFRPHLYCDPRFSHTVPYGKRIGDDTQQCERLNFQHTKAVWQASCHTAFSTSSYGSFDLSLLRLGMISPPGGRRSVRHPPCGR